MVLGLRKQTKAEHAIIYDNSLDPAVIKNGLPIDTRRICIRENEGDLTFLNLANPKNTIKDFDCTLGNLPGVKPEEFGGSAEKAPAAN
jgi:hypothetical protein